jgi:hypothetical protein
LKRRRTYVKEEVRATRLHIKPDTEKFTVKAEREEKWIIDGRTFTMGMSLKKGKN